MLDARLRAFWLRPVFDARLSASWPFCISLAFAVSTQHSTGDLELLLENNQSGTTERLLEREGTVSSQTAQTFTC